MINAELTHNPYLLQTSVKFNGHAPRINSQIEKYEDKILTDWVAKIPGIFYDEMNGYDFDLYFIGTKSDFEEVRNTFLEAGISEDLVRLFHKNELEDAETKSHEIDVLLTWLRENPNRKFDLESFMTDHAELFEGAYPFIIIRGNVQESIHPQISMESVESSDELRSTLLTNTPILFMIDERTSKQFRSDLIAILNRKDVNRNQLFFMIHPHMNAEQVERVISDLGVEKPQIVSAYDDEAILQYFRNYPITEYIREAIQVFEQTTTELSAVLEAENKESEIQNAEIHAVIDGIEDNISRLKLADEYFTERDNFAMPQSFVDLQNVLEDQICKWRNRKTKVVGDAECDAAAGECNADLSKYMSAFVSAVGEAYNKTALELHLKFKSRYASQGIDMSYDPTEIQAESPVIHPVSSVAEELLALKEITYEDPKPELMNFFRKNTAKEDREPVRVVTCYYERWRNKALEILMPVAGNILEENTERLRTYYDALAEAFHVHLTELIEVQEQEKDKVSAQLSDDERKLQEDNDWLSIFKDQLAHIERG